MTGCPEPIRDHICAHTRLSPRQHTIARTAIEVTTHAGQVPDLYHHLSDWTAGISSTPIGINCSQQKPAIIDGVKCVRFCREVNSDNQRPLLFPCGFRIAFNHLVTGIRLPDADFISE